MAERLGEALLDLRTDDKGFNAGVKTAEGRAQKLGGTLDQTSGKADNLSDRMRQTGAALQEAGRASSVAAGGALKEAGALYKLDAAGLAASKASVALAQAEYKRASAALAAARADSETSREAIAAAEAIKRKTFAVVEGARADHAAAIAARRVSEAHDFAVPPVDAFAKASRNAAYQQKMLMFQLNDVGVSLASGMPLYMVAIQQGSQMAQIYGPGEGGLGRALKETGKMAIGAVTRFPPLTAAIALGAAAIGGMTYEINRAQSVSVSFGDVAMATFEAIADSIYDLIKPAIDMLAPWFKSAWDAVVTSAKNAGNTVIRQWLAMTVDIGAVAKTIVAHFEHAFEAVTIIWSGLPGALGDLVFQTANRVVHGIEKMINAAAARINALNDLLPEWAQFDGIGQISLGGIDNPYAGEASGLAKRLAANVESEVAEVKAIWADRNARLADIARMDPLGDFYENVKDHAIENARERIKKKDKKGGGKSDADKYADLVRGAQQFIEAQERERASIGMTEQAAARLRYEQELLNKAVNDNIKLTPQQVTELKRLAGEMAAAEAKTSKLKEGFDFMKETAKGFVSDLKDGLREGKGFFEAFADAALNALDKVIDKLLNEAIDAIFQFNSAGAGGGAPAGGGGGIGSILGSIFSSIFSGFHATGGLIPNGKFGIVGDRGPEPVIGTSRGAMVLPNSSLRNMEGGRAAANFNFQQTITPPDGFETRTREENTPGGKRQEVWFEEAVGNAIAKRGSAQAAVRNVGSLTKR